MPRNTRRVQEVPRMSRQWLAVETGSISSRAQAYLEPATTTIPPCLMYDSSLGLLSTRDCTVLAAAAAGGFMAHWFAIGIDQGLTAAVSLKIEDNPGAFMAVFGPNGSGTTLDTYNQVSHSMRKMRPSQRLVVDAQMSAQGKLGGGDGLLRVLIGWR